MDSARLHRIIAGIESAIGLGAIVAPEKLVALYGIPSSDVNGIAAFGMRLFGIRNLAVGVANFAGSQQARDFTLAVQAPDLAMFAHAYKTGYIPKQAAAGAIATAGLVTALSLAAKRA
ncbi:MAG: hypothetical protein QOI80_2476 [Solirubrobacteraceae bacterium]|nr:hypothetical protein [Solirubrobacteraceae bacterium]